MKINRLQKEAPFLPSPINNLPLRTSQCYPPIDSREHRWQTDLEVTEFMERHFHPKEFTE